MLLGFIMIMHKGVSQEFQWINRWYLSELSDVLTTGKVILCICIYVISLRPIFPFLLTRLIIKGLAPDTIHGSRIIRRSYIGLVRDGLFYVRIQ